MPARFSLSSLISPISCNQYSTKFDLRMLSKQYKEALALTVQEITEEDVKKVRKFGFKDKIAYAIGISLIFIFFPHFKMFR